MTTENNILQISSKLGKYKIVSILGGGGFGTVYKGYDEFLQRYVAIKRSHTALEETELIEKFITEAKILAQLNHPNIVQVYDFDVDEELTPYIVMELVPGNTIVKYLQNLKQQQEQNFMLVVSKYFSELADALSFLHKKKIYHQDIKPENILVSAETGQVKLLDFGLAIIGTSHEMSRFEGTCRYCSPERFQEGFKPTIASDLYSLGIVLYEALTGRYAIPGKAIPDIIRNAISGQHNIIFQPEEADEVLKKVCLKCTEFEPEKRYQQASEVNLEMVCHIAEITPSTETAYLYMVEKQKNRILFPLTKRRNYIGRAFGNDIIIQDDSISRVHAIISIEDDVATITNISKTTPIRVNKKELTYQENTKLSRIDSIKISDYIFFYVPKKSEESLAGNDEYLSLEEAKLLLFLDENQINDLIQKGEFKSIQNGESLGLEANSIYHYIEKRSGNRNISSPTSIKDKTNPIIKITLFCDDKFLEEYKFDKLQKVITLGRNPECSIYVNDKQISRLHGSITKNDSGEYILQDLDSHNGIYANAIKIQNYVLKPGEKFIIGKYEFLFEESYKSAKVQNVTEKQISQKDKGTATILEGLKTLAPQPEGTSTGSSNLCASLVFTSDQGVITTKNVSKRFTFFGSSAECDFQFQQENIAPKQALLVKTENGFYLVDLINNQLVKLNNKEPNEEAPLNNGDSFSIGSQTYKFYLRT